MVKNSLSSFIEATNRRLLIYISPALLLRMKKKQTRRLIIAAGFDNGFVTENSIQLYTQGGGIDDCLGVNLFSKSG